MIEFKDFSFQYRVQSKPTLQNINLTIYEGEKVLIVGPSGSGKSTLAHCINGLVPNIFKGTVTGELKINGKNALKQNIFERSNEVGTVLQNPDDQFIGLTVGEDIAFKLENLMIPQAQMKEKVQQVADLVDLRTFLMASPHELSGGQKQRVTLAGVMVDEVDILLFDEPLANLDPATGQQTIALIDEIHQKVKKTIVIIEHRLEDVLYRKVDRIIVMSEGLIRGDLTPNQLLASPLLGEVGIREPLYITALKYAGCSLNETMALEQLDTMNIKECQDLVHQWYDQITLQPIQSYHEVALSFENVSFGYHPEHLTLKNVSLNVYKGEMISLVG